MTKSELRRELRRAYAGISPRERRERSQNIRQAILQTEEYKRAKTVFCYVSVDDEPETTELIDTMLKDGKTVLVPRCGNHGKMDAVQIRDRNELWPGRYGIPEPPRETEAFQAEQIDLALVPALAISEEGIRLGQGGGYYDRFAEKMKGLVWGITFYVRSVPAEPHDMRVDAIFK